MRSVSTQKHANAPQTNEPHIRRWVLHTAERLREIEARTETTGQKQARALVCLGFLLEEIVSQTCHGDILEEVQHLVTESQTIGQQEPAKEKR